MANLINEIPGIVKNNLPSKDKVENIIRENDQLLKAAGGAFLIVVGARFLSKTLGFLAFAGGAALLYQSATTNTKVKRVLDDIVAPEEVKQPESKLMVESV